MFGTNDGSISTGSQATRIGRRGGRMTKWKGHVASLSPCVTMLAASVSTLALSSSMPAVSYADCRGDATAFVCSGTMTDTEVIDGDAAGLMVTTEEGFAISSQTGDGLVLKSDKGSPNLTFADTHFASINGAQAGINARHNGSSGLTISTSGTVTGANSDAITALSYGSFVTIETADLVSGNMNGISVTNRGTGPLNIATSGPVSGSRMNGIQAINKSSDALNITAIAAVIGQARNGIIAKNYGKDLSITAQDVTGEQNGIQALNVGDGTDDGALVITTLGTVTGKSSNGLLAKNYGTDLSISAQTVTGKYNGVRAVNKGTGALKVSAQAISSEVHGIYGHNLYSNGALEISAAGAVTGIGGIGIDAENSGAPLLVSVKDVTAGTYGIKAAHGGAGNLAIQSTGVVQNTTDVDGAGLVARQTGTGDIRIDVVDVLGMKYGISASNVVGSGGLRISSTGLVQDQGLDAIRAINYGDDGILIDANDVDGALHGIYARNYGGGAIDITATGTVIGTTGIGIDAENTYYGNGTALSVTAVDVTGGTYGVKGVNNGLGDLTITSTGLVQNTTDTDQSAGVLAQQYNTGDVTVDVVNVTGTKQGIVVFGISSVDTVSVTSTGTVIGTEEEGINVNSYGRTIIIDAADVTGGHTGLVARGWRYSEMSITTSGTVTGGADGPGLEASSYYGRSVTIDAKNVSSGDQAVLVHTESVETIDITLSGVVTGGTGPGVDIYATGGANVNVTLNEGATVSSDNGQAIVEREDEGNLQNDPNTIVTLNSGSTVIGEIKLGSGSDRIVFAGGDFSGVTLFDGGDDTSTADTFIDIVTFSADIVGGDLVLERFQNWELIEVDGIALSDVGGAVAIGDGGVGTGLSLINGASLTSLPGFALTGRMTINTGSLFDASAGGASIIGTVSNLGTISLQDGVAGDVLTINGNLEGTGVLSFDTALGDDGSITDAITVSGDFDANAVIVVTNSGGLGAETIDGIELINVGGAFNGTATLQGDFETVDGAQAVTVGVYAYTLEVGTDGNLRLVAQDTIGGGGVATVDYQPSTPVYELYPNVLHILNRLPSYRERIGARKAATKGGEASAGQFQLSPFWVRMSAGHEKLKTDKSNTDADAIVDHVQISAGLEAQLVETANGAFHVGAVLSYGKAWGNTRSPYGDGDINSDAYGVGLTGTWVSDGGFYMDAQAKYNWFWTDLKSDDLGYLRKNDDGHGIAASLEFGQRVPLDNGLTLTPQAQFYYSGVYFDTFTDQNGQKVSKRDGDEWAVRAGLTAEKLTADGSSFYGLANLYYKINDNSTVDVSDANVGNNSKKLSVEMGFGADAQLSEKAQFYGEVAGRTSFESDFSLRGSFGVKWTF